MTAVLARRSWAIAGCWRGCCWRHKRSSDIRGGRYSTGTKGLMKVTIVGAGSETGKNLALCLKQSRIIDELAIYDVKPIRGLVHELSHTGRCKTLRYHQLDSGCGKAGLERALRDAKVLVIVNGRDKLLRNEADEVKRLVPGIVEFCPKALVAVVSSSVNSIVPMLRESLKKSGIIDERRLFGVTSLYGTRANGYAAETLGVAPEIVTVPVIGGACARSCVPLFSRTRPCADFTPEELSKMMKSMRSSDVAACNACEERNDNDEASSFCLGFAAARFCVSLCKALRDDEGVEECAYVRSCMLPEIKYCGERLILGPSGIRRRLGVPGLTDQECAALYEAIPEIRKKIALGEMLALGENPSTEICSLPAPCLIAST